MKRVARHWHSCPEQWWRCPKHSWTWYLGTGVRGELSNLGGLFQPQPFQPHSNFGQFPCPASPGCSVLAPGAECVHSLFTWSLPCVKLNPWLRMELRDARAAWFFGFFFPAGVGVGAVGWDLGSWGAPGGLSLILTEPSFGCDVWWGLFKGFLGCSCRFLSLAGAVWTIPVPFPSQGIPP